MGGGLLASSVTKKFTTGSYGTTGLQVLLSRLGYLPFTWTPKHGTFSLSNANQVLSAAYSAPAGSFSWQGNYPSQLTSQWRVGSYNKLVNGAVMAFESIQGLALDGDAGPHVWRDLLAAVGKHQANPNGYSFALGNQHLPETLTIWHNGREVMKTLMNSGAPGAPSIDGTFPVYLKFVVNTMKGTNPDGSKYNDVVHWINYFYQGDAVHAFPGPATGTRRASGATRSRRA